jgi:hypothetical protein
VSLWPLSVSSSRLVAASHTFAVWSKLPAMSASPDHPRGRWKSAQQMIRLTFLPSAAHECSAPSSRL